MKISPYKIWHLMMLSLLVIASGGCSMQTDPNLWAGDEPWDGDLYLQLNVKVDEGERNLFTRAGEEAPTVYPGEPAFNTERLQTLRVIMVNDDTEEIVYNRLNAYSGSEQRYKVDFDTPYRIYLIGNEAGLVDLLPYPMGIQSPAQFFGTCYQEGTKYPDTDAEDIRLEDIVLGRTGLLNPPEGGLGGGGLIQGRDGDDEWDYDWDDDGVNYIMPFIDNEPSELTVSTKLIPMTQMYTVRTVAKPVSGTESNVLTQETTFYITRSVTKFSFIFKKGDDYEGPAELNGNLPVKSIRIEGLGDIEYLFPRVTNYVKDPESDVSSEEREVADFEMPEIGNIPGVFTFDLPQNATWNTEISPQIYFAEGKGYEDENAGEMGGGGVDMRSRADTDLGTGGIGGLIPIEPEIGFFCSISHDGEVYSEGKKLLNLPYGLPRNTHVKVIITIKAESVEASVEVQPWYEEPKLNLDYRDNVSFSKQLEWSAGTYASLSNSTGNIRLRPWSSVRTRIPLEGEFRFETPIGATWNAFLIQTGGDDPGAFGFLRKDEDGEFIKGDDGNPLIFDSVSGTINDDRTEDDSPINSKLYIVSRFSNPSGNAANKALLQVVVNIGSNQSGTNIETSMTNNASYKYYTIIQDVE